MPFQGSKQTPYWRWLAYKVLCRGLTPFPINQILHHNHTALHLLHYYAHTIYNLCHNAYIVTPLLSTPEKNVCIKHTYCYHISTILYIHSEKTGHNVISLHTIWCFKLLKPMYTEWSKLCNHLSPESFYCQFDITLHQDSQAPKTVLLSILLPTVISNSYI
jgi:hypothetical protein